MHHRPTFALAAAALAFAAAGAQAASLPHKDAAFMRDAAEAGTTEIEASKIAESQATSADVKTFARTMIDDHGKAAAELQALAQQKNLKLPEKPSVTQTAEIKMLSARKGASFDQHYAESIGVKAHQDTVKLFQKEAEQGEDPDVKAWAAKTLPALQHHLEMAQALKTKTDAEPKK